MFTLYEVKVRARDIDNRIRGGADFKIACQTENIAILKALKEMERLNPKLTATVEQIITIGWVDFIVI